MQHWEGGREGGRRGEREEGRERNHTVGEVEEGEEPDESGPHLLIFKQKQGRGSLYRAYSVQRG